MIAVFSSSLIVFSIFSFIGILALNYDRYIKYWVDLKTFIIISIILFIIYEWIFFVIVFPSMIRFGNRQTCAHENPVYIEIQEIKNTLKKIELELKR